LAFILMSRIILFLSLGSSDIINPKPEYKEEDLKFCCLVARKSASHYVIIVLVPPNESIGYYLQDPNQTQ